MSKLLRSTRKRSTAQAMVEFGLALPILLIVMYGLIESGRLLFLYASVVSAARQAVRYGSATGDSGSGIPYYNNCAGIRAAAKSLGFIQPFTDANIQISYDNGPNAAVPWSQTSCPITSTDHPINGDRIRVQVSTQYSPIVPLVPFKPFAISSVDARTLLINISVAVNNPGVILTPGAGGNVSFSKDATPSSYDTLGQTITYTFTINNLGSTPITNISVSDSLTGGANCSGATDPLAGGASTTCTATYVITQADIDNLHVNNVATLTALSNGIPISAQASKTINFVPRPQLTLTKTGDVTGYVGVGLPIGYTFTLQNTGNVALTGPYTIIDPNLNDWTCSAAVSPLAIGATTTCTGNHIITSNDMNRTYVNNTATATALFGGFTVTSNPSSTQVLVPALLLSVTASPTSVSALGTTITYTYTLRNRTSKTMYLISVTDSRAAPGSFLCLGSLASGATGTCTATYSGYTQTDMNAGLIISQAFGKVYKGVTSNTVSTTVTVTQTPQLTLTKTVTPTSALTVGAQVTYSYSFKNTGNVTLNVPYSITDNKLTGIDCTGATGTLAPGATKSCANKTYNITSSDIAAGSIINQATVSAVFGTTPVTSAPASATVITFAGARLGLLKTSTPTYFSTLGQTIQYNYTLVNTGGLVLSPPFSVSDPKVPTVTCPTTGTLAIGGTVVCTGNYVITIQDYAAGSVTNTATATAMNGVMPVISGTATLTVTQFLCDNAHLKATPTPIATGTDVFWTIINNTGLPLHIGSATVSWYTANPLPYLTLVKLGTTTIFSGTNGSYSGFVLPGSGWTVPTGSTNMELQFSSAASGIRVILTFTDPGCSSTTLDSNVNYGG